MKFAPAVLTVFALACARAGAGAAADASASLPLTLSGTGPYYVLDIDAQARKLSAAPGLGDLRVRNGAGETLPFAWVDPPQPAAAPLRAPARLYKVPLPPGDAASATTAAAPQRQAWIVDTKEAGDDLLRLELGLERDTQGVWTLRVEASDDLQHWRTLQQDAQLVQLQALPQVGAAGTLAPQAERERLAATGIDLDEQPARYLRLTTAPRSAIPPLVSASVIRSAHRPPPPPLEWSAAIAASSCESNACDYTLPANTPVAALQVMPSDIDTIGNVMVLGQVDAAQPPPRRHSLLRGSLHALRLKARRASPPGLAWDSAAIGSVYWLSQPAGAPDLHSPPLRLDGANWRALRIETFGPITQLGHAAPAIRIAVHRRQLVFVARGTPPFVLARAGMDVTPAPMTLASLMPGRAADDPLPAASAALAPVAVASAAATPASAASAARAAPAPRTGWLWAALLGGLAVMGAMAWSLLRKPRAPQA
ncbi:MAG: DUF3999 family protein [Burkholderiales bacterium]|nr:DUF3999 family protein [Burkholderiales bacterium]